MKKACVIFLGLALSACSRSSHNHKTFSGTLELTEYSVGLRVTGKLQSLLIEESQTVKKGDLVATLERFEQAERDYQRAQQLLKAGGGSKQALEQAQLAWEDQRIVSPVDGVVLVKVHEQGEVVQAGSPVAVIGDRSKMWVRIYVPEGMINQVTLNQKALVRFDGLQQQAPAHVSFIAPKAEFTPRNVQTPEERVTQVFAVKVVLDNPEANLRPGVAADVTLE